MPEDVIGALDELDQRVTPLELFFYLVFVFAITQVTGYVSARISWTRLIAGLAILAVLWFAWRGYAWLGNAAHTDDGLVRVMLLAALAAMLIASLAVPHAFGRHGLIFGVAYFVARVLHVGCYAAGARARNDRACRPITTRQRRAPRPNSPGSTRPMRLGLAFQTLPQSRTRGTLATPQPSSQGCCFHTSVSHKPRATETGCALMPSTGGRLAAGRRSLALTSRMW